MSNIRARLHMHLHTEPQGRAYIIGERPALRELGEALIKASKSIVGLETVNLYTSDGHRYEIMITCDVSDAEWQTLPPPYDPDHQPDKLTIVKTYDEVMSQ